MLSRAAILFIYKKYDTWRLAPSACFVICQKQYTVQDDPFDYVRGAKALIDRKKHSLEAAAAYLTANLLTKLLGAKGCGAIAHRVLSNSTFSNLVGPLEEVSFYGHPVAYIAPNALHMHFRSYVDKMTICLGVDPRCNT
ncbi:hypothetical protein Prudu_007770 [Prunus dulcis]|uniref:O-acyltransferase WSD1 C-terminal domain-containing protein n=1 Tax=Prunus dulcis TaxID=3755 RepID=A0A4Y1R2P1_PRUDU|nr:hypothetical protein Prudu_007770 [Prunus dulcis]